jgi:hypothetical protein
MNGSPSVLARLTQLREHGCVADPTKVAKSCFIGVLYAPVPTLMHGGYLYYNISIMAS